MPFYSIYRHNFISKYDNIQLILVIYQEKSYT
jgi:hypothetical protein